MQDADDGFPRHGDKRVDAWIQHAKAHDSGFLRDVLAADAVFHSPVVHTAQVGRDKVFGYLDAAGHVFAGSGFRYDRVIVDGDEAVLEFSAEKNGIHINGIDMIRWNADGKISNFKVMVRPLKAVHMLWEEMGAQLNAAGG
jgi:hypothetical protein